MKKKLLFVMNNLHCGGAENSLVSMLQFLDYTKYDVHLLLFKKEGFFLNNIPKAVVVLDPIIEFTYFDGPFLKTILKAILKFRFDIVFARIALVLLKNEKNKAAREQKFWKYLSFCLPKLKGNYDVAIGFLEKTPNYYVVDKVSAKKKIGFIRTDYQAMGMLSSIDLPYFEKLHYILTNSINAQNSLLKIFPKFSYKIAMIENFFSEETINFMSKENIELPQSDLNIVSIGRLHEVKGFDLAIEACSYIVQSGINVKWYVLGEGLERNNLTELINKYNLKNNFILLGLKDNPYPYLKLADIYAQTSLFEGKSRAVEEAKILKKLILVTNYPSVKDQITHLVNGYVVGLDAKEIANGIIVLFKDQILKKALQTNLKLNLIDNNKHLDVLYKIINN